MPFKPSELRRVFPEPVRELARALVAAGGAAFAVGGCVRDFLRGLPPADFDIATSLAPNVVVTLFKRAIPTGLSHGTVMVPTSAGPVDITTYRRGAALVDDLRHRDFTCNAIALDLLAGAIHDPLEGRRDLVAGVLRTPASPRATLAADPLRVLRAGRFVSTLGFRIEPTLRAALPEFADALEEISPERVASELKKLLAGRFAVAGLRLLRDCGAEATLLRTPPGAGSPLGPIAFTDDPVLRLALWLPQRDPGGWLGRFRFSREETRRIVSLAGSEGLSAGATDAASVRHAVARLGRDRVNDALDLVEARSLACLPDRETARTRRGLVRNLRTELARIDETGVATTVADLAVDGKWVMERLDCDAGPAVGAALRYLRDEVVRDPSCNRPDRLGALLDRFEPRD